MRFRDSSSFGKRQEYSVVAELLKRNFDVYMTLVDDQGIDCVIRLDHKRYLDIQIKARSKEAKQGNFFAAMNFTPRNNLFFIFYTEYNDTFWIMPSFDVKNLSITNKSGANKGKCALTLPRTIEGTKAAKFEKYRNNKGFSLLNKYKGA
jgi:hypothetical protein